jgi:hypothetical protein
MESYVRGKQEKPSLRWMGLERCFMACDNAWWWAVGDKTPKRGLQVVWVERESENVCNKREKIRVRGVDIDLD